MSYLGEPDRGSGNGPSTAGALLLAFVLLLLVVLEAFRVLPTPR